MLILSNAPVPDEQAAQLRALSPKIELMSFRKGTVFPNDALSRAEIVYTENGLFERADAPKLRDPQGPIFLDCKLNADVAAPFMSEFAHFEGRH